MARGPRRGFALPLALFLLLLMAMLVALLFDGALQELRSARGDLAAARAQAAAETALADLLVSLPDSALLARPRGALSATVIASGSDTTRVSLQSLGGVLLRGVASARVWTAGLRADAVTMAFARIVPDTAVGPGALRFRRLPGWWWAQLP